MFLPAQPSLPTLRQGLLYALPALILGAVLRLSYLAAIPEAFVHADTSSYLPTAFELWEKGEWTMKAKRRWWYPLALIVVPALPGTIAQSIAAVHHFIGLAAVLAVAWIVGHLTRFWRLWIPPVTLLVAAWPMMLIYEHIFLAESVFVAAFMLAVALSLPVQRLKEPGRLLAFLLALTCTVGLRPSGRAMWLGALILLLLVARERRPWRWWNIAAALLCTATAFTAGSDGMGSRLLLSSMLPLVDTERAAHREYRQALRPLILEARHRLGDYAWYQSKFKDRLDRDGEPMVGAAWHTLREDDAQFGRVCQALAFETILRHPLAFTRFTLTKFAAAAATPAALLENPKPSWELSPRAFWFVQAENNQRRWEKMGPRLPWIYGGLERAAWEKMAAERATRTLWFGPFASFLERTFPWAIVRVKEDVVGVVRATWLGWLALAGLLACLLPRRFVPSLMLWLSMLLYLGLSFGVGDRLSRFTLPVQWCGLCLAVIALDTICSAVAQRFPAAPRV